MKSRGVRALVAAWAMLLVGCSATVRYRVLSFLFDGVPPPGSGQGGGSQGGSSLLPGSSGRSGPVFVHGPYAARMCDACHQRPSVNGLVAPRSELCAQCHDVRPTGTVVHGPFAAGACLECHNPHSSPRRYMLVAEVGQLCERCHEPESLRAVAAHDPFDERCTECHAPHSSDSAHLLR